jgi:hypothetical protein
MPELLDAGFYLVSAVSRLASLISAGAAASHSLHTIHRNFFPPSPPPENLTFGNTINAHTGYADFT